MKDIICQRVEQLRCFLREHHLHAFIFPSTDPHSGEYIPDYWAARQWISGFNGSAGTAVVTRDHAALWTDSRYFIAAAEQLDGTPFQLMKDRLPETPDIATWLGNQLQEGDIVGVDGKVNTFASVSQLQHDLSTFGIHTETHLDPTTTLWKSRPVLPSHPVMLHPLDYAGTRAEEKLHSVQQHLQTTHAKGIVISTLDEIAWLLNLRGTDVHCNPVFVSYLLITDRSYTLYIYKEKLTPEVIGYLESIQVKTVPYDRIFDDLAAYPEASIQMDPNASNYALFDSLPATCHIHRFPSPVAMMKAVKNPTEVEGYRRAMIKDGIAMVKFLKWLKPAVAAGGQTEISIDRKLTSLRAAQEGYRDISFDTIAGYGQHGAIVHYEATPETDTELLPKGFLLLDSGAQYLDGTTDITRTIALGPLTEEERHDYTLVLKGHICLARVKFPEGSSGTQLDICARYAMWQEGINYLHGTGHGVGAYLNVHEGPHQLRMNYMPAPLRPYMTLTNEPGIYKPGKHGVRIENTQLIIPYKEGEFGAFLQFEPLTLCPIDTTPVVTSMLAPEEKEWLNTYHTTVYEQLAPHLDDEHRNWLKEATAPIS